MKENKHKQKTIKNSFVCILLFLSVVVLGLPISTFFAYFLVFQGRVYPRTTLCGENITGERKPEVEKNILFLTTSAPEKIILSVGQKSFDFKIPSVNYQSKATLNNIFSSGREKNPFLNINRIYSLYTEGNEIKLDFSFDSQLFESEIASVAAKFYQPTIDPEIKVITTKGQKSIFVEQGKSGVEVDRQALISTLENFMSCPKKENKIEIPLKQSPPPVSTEILEKVKDRASRLLNKKIVLKLDDQTWNINDEELINFLSFNEGFNRQKIIDYAGSFAKTTNSSPENAAFQFENNAVKVFKPSKDGITIKEKELAQAIEESLFEIEKTAQDENVTIPFIKIPASISTGDVNNLGIKELIGRGTSLFYGSIPERIHNVQLASLKLNGILIPPDETFSFNRSLGDVSQNTGFKQAYIIKEGRTILGDGGGVCQVSTTLFRAAINAGLPITERHAHAYRVHYYEDDLGPGFDATVYDPSADLKIKNDTPAYILIQSSINLKKKQLFFDLYGTKDDRKAEVSKARVWDKQPPPPDLYQDDPTLPTGVIKQVDWKAWGAKAAFDYKVTKNGETIFEKTFNSSYRPWQAVYLRGTMR